MGLIMGILFNACPKCFKGQVFGGFFFQMNVKCSECGFVFEREPGYFTGATPLSYGLGFIVTLPTFLFLLFKDISLGWTVAIPGIQLVLLSPLLFRFSRLIWLHMDCRYISKMNP